MNAGATKQAGPIKQSSGISIELNTLHFGLNVLRFPTDAASRRDPTWKTFSFPINIGSLRLSGLLEVF